MTVTDDINDALAEARTDFGEGITITYHDGSGNSVDLTGKASLGATERDQTDYDGMVLQTQWQDVLVKASDLILDGSVVEPQSGDKVKVTNAVNVMVYDVSPIGDEPCFRYRRGTNRTELRIHTNEAYTETLP